LNISQKHIVFLTPGFATSEKDSTNIPALQVYLKSLKETQPNLKISLLSFQFPFSNKTYKWHGITIIPLNGKNKYYKKLWTWYKALQTLKKIHNVTPISTVHSFWIGECSFIGNRFSKKHNINHIVTAMGQDVLPKNSYAKYLQNSKAKIVTLSKNHQYVLSKNYNLKSKIIYWHLDTKSFPKLQKSTIDILGVGALNEVKNFSNFISIISILVKSLPNLKVEIIGKGTMRTKLEKQIEDLKLTKNINLIGQLPRQDVLIKMSQTKILLHTSNYESFGYVFSEALFSGMQVVSYNVGNAQPLVQWKICNSKKEIIEALKATFNEPKKNKERIILTPKNSCVNSYLKMYNE